MTDKRHPLLDLRTPLSLIPKWWLDTIEPHIRRPSGTACWLWDGAVDKTGEPILRTGGHQQRVKRIVAGHYWELMPETHVLHACGKKNCLAPFHFYVTDLHPSQEDRTKILRAKKISIDRWGKTK